MLLMLAAGAHTPVPDPEPDPEPGEPWITDLTPTWQNTIHVGASRTIKTLADAITTINADGGGVASTSPSSGIYGGGAFTGTPRVALYRSVIVLDPGEYTIPGETLQLIGGIDIVGATGDPADVIITIGEMFAFNTVNDLYMGGLTYHLPDVPSPSKSYAVHMTGMALDTPVTAIYENCKFIDEDNSRPGGALGWDAPDNSYALLVGCEIESDRRIIFHGDLSPVGVKVAMLDTHFTGAGSIPSAVSGIDNVWTVGVTVNGLPVPDQRTGVGGTIPATAADLPALTNGTHRPARYSPSTATTGPVTATPAATPGDLGPVALTPGIVYYVPIPITTAGKIGNVEASLPTPAGTVALGLYTEKTNGTLDFGGISQTAPAPATVSMSRGLQAASNWPRGYLTRDHRVYAAILVTDTNARVLGSTSLSTTVQCYRSTTTQTGVAGFPPAVEPVPAGTSVPWLTLGME